MCAPFFSDLLFDVWCPGVGEATTLTALRKWRPTGQEERVKLLFLACYQNAKMELSNAKATDLIELQKASGCNGLEQFLNLHNDSYGGVVECIAEVLKEDEFTMLTSSFAYALMSDGSQDRATTEEECCYIRTCDPSTMELHVGFLGLQEIDINESRDGYSHDSPAIVACYETLMQSGDFLDWADTLAFGGADGANVMQGTVDGVAGLLKTLAGGHFEMFHTVAHRLELGITDAIKEHVEDLEDLLKGLYSHYENSPKQKAALKKLSLVLDDYDPVAFVGLHGIRWVASKTRALQAVIKNLQLVNVDLHRKSVAKLPAAERNACGLSLLSPAVNFVGFKFPQMFGEDKHMGTVQKVLSLGNGGDTNDFDLFEVKYDDNEVRELSRNDLIHFADARPGREEAWAATDRKGKCKIPERALWLRLTNYTNMAMLHHMADILTQLRVLSLLMQKDQLTYQPLADGINRGVAHSRHSAERDGPHLQKFLIELEDASGRQAEQTFRHLPLHNCEVVDAPSHCHHPVLCAPPTHTLHTSHQHSDVQTTRPVRKISKRRGRRSLWS